MPPKLVVSKPLEEVANTSERTSLPSRRRRTRPNLASTEQGIATSSQWIDVDESPPPRRSSSKRSSRRQDRASGSSRGSQIDHSDKESDLGRFFPRLSQIIEVNESTASSKPSTRDSEHRRRRDRSATRRGRRRDDTSSSTRRPVRHRTGGVQRRNESLLKVNPSLLSVLSSLNGTSDRSSRSSSTITQQSYDRRGSDTSRAPNRRSESNLSANMTSRTRSKSPNVFDYMEEAPFGDGHDGHSVASSSSSHYEPSDAGSSEAPGTPSSRSTFPSPTTTKSRSVAELRRKYDAQNAASPTSIRSHSRSPASSVRSLRKQPSVSDVPEGEEDDDVPPLVPSEVAYDPQRRSSSQSSRGSRRSERLQQQEESMRQHMAYAQQGHYVETVYGQHRSISNSSGHSDRSPYPYQMAMQQYQWPSPPVPPALTQVMNGHIAERPPAPEAPDLTQRTLTGYEQLALELSGSETPVKPLYRKFEYLNHRILLHLQDELSELEEQLRTVDEIIAQLDPALADGQKTPVSRRGEAFHGSEIHLRRTQLLGHIFVKTEQYNRAMSSYASMAKDSMPADEDQVSAYQQWISKYAPVHEVETRFLQRGADLIDPRKAATSLDRPTKHVALVYLPVALMLPLLLFSIIPSLAGRLTVTSLMAVGAFIIAATTRIRYLMPAHEWAVCGAVYVLLMGAIAGCIPQHGS